MNLFQAIILLVLAGNTVLGVFVLLSNPRRVLNIGFALLSFLILNWLGSLYFSSIQESPEVLLFWVRQTSAAAGMSPIGFLFIYLAIANPELSFVEIFFKIRYWVIACFFVIILCHSPFFALSATPATDSQMVPASTYGWGFGIYILFFFSVTGAMMFGFFRDFKKSSGVQKVELQFLQIGGSTSLFLGASLLAASVVVGNQELGRFVPLSVLLLDGFIAYGIATRRIFSASEVLQRVVSYLLLGVYLIALYILSQWTAAKVLHVFRQDVLYASHLVAAIVVAFSVVPAQSWMQRFAGHLFSSSKQFDVSRVLEGAERMFQEVSTEETLMDSFSSFMIRVFGTTRIVLLTAEPDGSFRQHYTFPDRDDNSDLFLNENSGLVELIARDKEPFTTDTLERMRASSAVILAREEMKARAATVVAGGFFHKRLKMIVVLSEKETGAIYDLREQRALQRLCNQFAVAFENAHLYTAVQDGKIYNEILLDSLASGIVAVDENREVTVFNQRAQAITQLSADDVLNAPIERLPDELVEVIDAILSRNAGIRDHDTFIGVGDEDRVPIRVSGCLFHGHTGKQLGVLLVFNDMTTLRKMEDQIRRTDRLSSIGTLSAGMAHEIKNPLVTIKTFTELLPEKYDDEEFRTTFFDLVNQEVLRIDAIVGRLLNFSRPVRVSLKPVCLHKVIRNSLRLVEQELLKNQIELDARLKAERHRVMADAEQINQALVNFFLNAIQAMEPGGVLRVETSQQEDLICIYVRDSGCGLSDEQKRHIFDPFFTTKETGVGLGLSVSHGIIQEHHGAVYVESEQGVGTVFRVEMPLIDEKEI
jgi:signal transduction histidine kinase